MSRVVSSVLLQFTCEKDVGMGLCMFNFVIMLSLLPVSVLFGTYIPTSFEKVFFVLVSVCFFLSNILTSVMQDIVG